MLRTAEAITGVLLGYAVFVMTAVAPAAAQAPSNEARRHLNRGLAAVEMAKQPTDYDAAIEEFRKAQALAPGWPDAYCQLGLAQEKAGRFRDAVLSLRKCLQLAPSAPDATAIRTLIDKTEYKAEQVVTDEDALEIFASLAETNRWHAKGVTAQDAWEKIRWVDAVRRDGSDLLVPFQERCSYGTKTQRVTPNGKSLEFRTIYCLCERSVQHDECPEVSRFTFEIASKQRVKLAVRKFWPAIRGQTKAEVYDHAFEFVRGTP
jgi:tetratricopeptide (TPR) repeat protein